MASCCHFALVTVLVCSSESFFSHPVLALEVRGQHSQSLSALLIRLEMRTPPASSPDREEWLPQTPAAISADSTQFCLPWAWLNTVTRASNEAFHLLCQTWDMQNYPTLALQKMHMSFLLCQHSYPSPQVTADITTTLPGQPLHTVLLRCVLFLLLWSSRWNG